MGGNGSTRWKDHQKARLVEGCHQLSAATFERALKHDQAGGILHWTDSRDPVGFIQSRSRAPQTFNSQLVTMSLALAAQDPYRPGRSWGRRAGRIARGG